MLIEEHEALAMVERYRTDFVGVLLKSWEEYMEKIQIEQRQKFDKTTRANVVHSFIRHRFHELLDRHDMIHIPDTGKLLLVVLHNAAAMKVKKLSDELLSSNVRTKQTRQFRCHQTLSIEGVEEVGHLELGYELDSFEQAIKTVWLLCPNGMKRNYWACPIWGDEASGVLVDMFPGVSPSEPYKKFSAKVSEYGEQESDTAEDQQ